MKLCELINDGLIGEGERIAVGVSGGADSMLLLFSLLEKRKQLNFYFKVIHVNHHLRGEESDRDQKLVESVCKKHKVDYVTLCVDVKNLKSEGKKTLEEAARIARYDAIFAEMKRDNLSKLFVAHHKNDQAETILMNIFRGSGLLGAAGIKNQAKIVRPLLKVSKAEILSLCKEHDICFVEDSTNLQNDCTRNYVRNVILPEIERVYPSAVQAISEFGERAGEVYAFIQTLLDAGLVEKVEGGVLIKESAFLSEKFLVREYLKLGLSILGVDSDIEAKHYNLLYELYSLPLNSVLDLPHKISAKRVRNGVKLYKKTAKKDKICEFEFILGELQIVDFGKIKAEIISSEDVNFGDGNYYIDYMKIPENSVWRHRKQGDLFAKLGSGAKKLNDYFTDKKVEVDDRDDIIILASKEQVLLALGYDVGENVKISPETDQIVKISVSK